MEDGMMESIQIGNVVVSKHNIDGSNAGYGGQTLYIRFPSMITDSAFWELGSLASKLYEKDRMLEL